MTILSQYDAKKHPNNGLNAIDSYCHECYAFDEHKLRSSSIYRLAQIVSEPIDKSGCYEVPDYFVHLHNPATTCM